MKPVLEPVQFCNRFLKPVRKTKPVFENRSPFPTQNNLISLFVHNLNFPIIRKNFFKKCNNINCNTCLFANTNYFISLKNNFDLPIFNDSNCSSNNAIYIIHCKLCNYFYIGQTNCIKKRIYNHLYKIKNFVPFDNNNTCVSIHFNLKGHNFLFHFNFYVLRCDIENLDDRLNIENFTINLFIKLNVKIINDYIPGMLTLTNNGNDQ